MKGIITSLQRMSIHDGPGLRTVIFLKGCNMRCKWCHNPETWSKQKQIQYIKEKCIRCTSCINTCPSNALKLIDNQINIDHEKCTSCGLCEDVCCTGAISIVGKEMEPEELFDAIRNDIPYLKESNGGITLSGGEPTLQKDFIKEFLLLCKKGHIHTAIETNMSMPWKTIESLIPLIDYWMCDMKIFNESKHKYWTGITNTSIIKHITQFGKLKIPLQVRIPIIPDVNDTETDILEICKLLAPYSDTIKCKLLAFHTLGFSKFETLGIQNELSEKEALSKQKLENLKEIVTKYNLLYV